LKLFLFVEYDGFDKLPDHLGRLKSGSLGVVTSVFTTLATFARWSARPELADELRNSLWCSLAGGNVQIQDKEQFIYGGSEL
jgi:hypothetical protein